MFGGSTNGIRVGARSPRRWRRGPRTRLTAKGQTPLWPGGPGLRHGDAGRPGAAAPGRCVEAVPRPCREGGRRNVHGGGILLSRRPPCERSGRLREARSLRRRPEEPSRHGSGVLEAAEALAAVAVDRGAPVALWLVPPPLVPGGGVQSPFGFGRGL